MGNQFTIESLRRLQLSIKQWYGVDISEYSYSFFYLRIEDFILANKILDIEDLIGKVSLSQYWYEKLMEYLMEKETEIFRDPGFWKYMRDVLMPSFGDAPIKVWFPDVSTGEELFSFLILAKEVGVFNQVEVMASCMCKKHIEKIENGFLSAKNFVHNADNFKRFNGYGSVNDYFIVNSAKAYLKTELLKPVSIRFESFREHDNESDYDLVIFRNKMLIHDELYQNSALNFMSAVIKPKGFLCIGINETMQNSLIRFKFQEYEANEKIFQKRSN